MKKKRIKTNSQREIDKKYQKRRRLENPEWKKEQTRLYTQKYPEKVKAISTLNRAVHRKKIEKLPCEICGRQDVHAHHEDYSKPLEVIWLCPICHKKWHMTFKKEL